MKKILFTVLKQVKALVVKLVDTKDLKAEGFTSESVRGSPRQSKHPIKSYKIKYTLKLNNKIKRYKLSNSRTSLVHREINQMVKFGYF